MSLCLTCNSKTVSSAGAQDPKWRRLVLPEESVPLSDVVVPKEVERFCRGGDKGLKAIFGERDQPWFSY